MLTTFWGFDPEGGKAMKCSRSITLLLLLLSASLVLSLLLLLLLLSTAPVLSLPLLVLVVLPPGGVAESTWLVSSAALCCQKDTMLSGVTTVAVWPLQTMVCSSLNSLTKESRGVQQTQMQGYIDSCPVAAANTQVTLG
jgi:hypothetical protein